MAHFCDILVSSITVLELSELVSGLCTILLKISMLKSGARIVTMPITWLPSQCVYHACSGAHD